MLRMEGRPTELSFNLGHPARSIRPQGRINFQQRICSLNCFNSIFHTTISKLVNLFHARKRLPIIREHRHSQRNASRSSTSHCINSDNDICSIRSPIISACSFSLSTKGFQQNPPPPSSGNNFICSSFMISRLSQRLKAKDVVDGFHHHTRGGPAWMAL